MAARRQRDAGAEFMRLEAAEVRGRLGRRFWGPGVRGLHRLLNFLIGKLPPSRFLYAIGVPVGLFGWVTALAWPLTGLVSAWTSGFQLAATGFPPGGPQDVAGDSHGRLDGGDSLHHRVQRYSPDGE